MTIIADISDKVQVLWMEPDPAEPKTAEQLYNELRAACVNYFFTDAGMEERRDAYRVISQHMAKKYVEVQS